MKSCIPSLILSTTYSEILPVLQARSYIATSLHYKVVGISHWRTMSDLVIITLVKCMTYRTCLLFDKERKIKYTNWVQVEELKFNTLKLKLKSWSLILWFHYWVNDLICNCVCNCAWYEHNWGIGWISQSLALQICIQAWFFYCASIIFKLYTKINYISWEISIDFHSYSLALFLFY